MLKALSKDGALRVKQKILIASGITIKIHREGCIASPVDSAIKAEVTQAGIGKTIAVDIIMGGGAYFIYGDKAYKAMKEMK
jgi:alkylhydroperoxidase/carboxymuconolactone decarboxylase family protein YurZ